MAEKVYPPFSLLIFVSLSSEILELQHRALFPLGGSDKLALMIEPLPLEMYVGLILAPLYNVHKLYTSGLMAWFISHIISQHVFKRPTIHYGSYCW